MQPALRRGGWSTLLAVGLGLRSHSDTRDEFTLALCDSDAPTHLMGAGSVGGNFGERYKGKASARTSDSTLPASPAEQIKVDHKAGSSPFIYPELIQGLLKRAADEERIQKLIHQYRSNLQELQIKHGPTSDEVRVAAQQARERINEVMFGAGEGSSGESRAEFLEKYGCTGWTDDALKSIARHGPLLEIGAGKGQWARELRRRYGVDVLAYDSFEDVPGRRVHSKRSRTSAAGAHSVPRTHQGLTHGAKFRVLDQVHVSSIVAEDSLVLYGTEAAITLKNSSRTLFLCYPPPGDMSLKCLSRYEQCGGRKVIYVGEGRGGANANDQFFARLESENWRCIEVVDIRPFPGGYEKLFIFERRPNEV